MKIRSKRTMTGDLVVIIVCALLILACVLPMLNLFAQSFSSSQAVINGKVKFLPVIHSYKEISSEDSSYGGYSYGDSSYDDNFSLDNFSLDNFSLDGFSLDGFSDDNSYEDDFSDDNSYEDDFSVGNFSAANTSREVNTYKIGMTLESYRYVFLDPAFTRSMWWTAILTAICTIVSLTMTILCAFPLTYGWLKGKAVINTIIIFTMYFGAGTIPNYILMKSLHLLNNPLVLIIPNCLSVFNMIILRSFFYGIPVSLRESAEMDGANPFTVLVKIYLPLSGAVLATLALFYAVGRWNGFGDALLYISGVAQKWYPIQLKLWTLIQNQTSIDISTVELVGGTVPRASDAIKAAAIMFATVPILVVYPWLQRHFIVGVTIGGVKE